MIKYTHYQNMLIKLILILNLTVVLSFVSTKDYNNKKLYLFDSIDKEFIQSFFKHDSIFNNSFQFNRIHNKTKIKYHPHVQKISADIKVLLSKNSRYFNKFYKKSKGIVVDSIDYKFYKNVNFLNTSHFNNYVQSLVSSIKDKKVGFRGRFYYSSSIKMPDGSLRSIKYQYSNDGPIINISASCKKNRQELLNISYKYNIFNKSLDYSFNKNNKNVYIKNYILV